MLPHIIALVGWSGCGKTTLIESLLPLLQERAIKVGLIKHSHHRFDVDHQGKDTYRYRQAGCKQIIITSASRYVYMHEIDSSENEASLADCVQQFDAVDLILVEGFKCADIDKIEIYRPSLGKPRLDLDSKILAVASDENIPDLDLPQLDLNNPLAIAKFILALVYRDNKILLSNSDNSQ